MNRILVLFLSVILAVSCNTIRKVETTNTETNQVDSVVSIEGVSIDTLKVSMDSVAIALPVSFLSDTTFTEQQKRSGRATVTVYKSGQKIYVSAVCDSLEKLLISKNTEIRQLKAKLSSRATNTRIKKSGTAPLVPLIIVVIGLIVFIVLNYLYRKATAKIRDKG